MVAEGHRCRLYLITPSNLVGEKLFPFADSMQLAIDAGDVACVQLRLKNVQDETIRKVANLLQPMVQKHQIPFILNDRADLAAEFGCDGVHIGQSDTPYKKARELVGPNSIVGVTCHSSTHLAMTAGEAGADYVAFGAFFESSTKKPKYTAQPNILSKWQKTMTLPCVAIGGINTENCQAVVEAGADFIAVSAGVWNHPEGPGKAVENFNEIFDRHSV